MQEEIEKSIASQIDRNTLEKVGNLYLTKYQQSILENHHIPYKTCKSTNDLLFLLSEIKEEEEYDDLEEVAGELQEFYYYHESHK